MGNIHPFSIAIWMNQSISALVILVIRIKITNHHSFVVPLAKNSHRPHLKWKPRVFTSDRFSKTRHANPTTSFNHEPRKVGRRQQIPKMFRFGWLNHPLTQLEKCISCQNVSCHPGGDEQHIPLLCLLVWFSDILSVARQISEQTTGSPDNCYIKCASTLPSSCW